MGVSRLPPISRTALLVIDMQNGFCREEGSAKTAGFDVTQCAEAIVPCQNLIAAARRHEMPVVYTRLIWREDYRDGGVVTGEVIPGLVEAKMCAAGSWDAELIDEMCPQPKDFIVG